MPKVPVDMAELIESIVLMVEAVHGVIGGGDIGVLGVKGHLILGLDVSSIEGAKTGEVIPTREAGPLYEAPDRTSCFKAVTGPLEKLNRGEAGVRGLDKGELRGVTIGGS